MGVALHVRPTLLVCVLGAACGRVDFAAVPLPTVDVAPGFMAASRWRDYVTLTPSPELFRQNDELCDLHPPTEVADCVQAGIVRKVTLDLATCAGVTAADSEAALQWACDDSTGIATMYSTGFVPGKGLADLVRSGGWRSMSVRVDLDGRGYAESVPTPWWTDSVVPLPDNDGGAQVTLADPNTIYVLDTSRASAGYLVDADGISLVVAHGATLTASGTALNCDNASGAGGTRRCLIATTARENLWIEGDIDVAGDANVGVLLAGAIYSRIHSARVVSAQDENVLLFAATGNFIDDLSVANAGADGLAYRGMANYNAAYNVRAFSNGRSVASGAAGILVEDSGESSFVGLTLANNHEYGALTRGTSSYGNTFAFVTAVDNDVAGVEMGGSGVDSIVNAFAANQPIGIRLAADDQFAGELVLADNGIGVCGASTQIPEFFDGSVFGGNGTDCMQGAACTTAVACSTWGDTRSTVTTGVDTTDAFAGKVVADDAANLSDAAGAATGGVADWLHFASSRRGWGADGGVYPDAGNRGTCTSACRIWDFSTSTTDALATRDETAAIESEAIAADVPCPSALAPTRALADWIGNELDPNATENIGDGYGDDDGLCEAHEHCTYSARYGADQGAPAAISSPACTYPSANRPRWIHAAP